jgi:hypothetical protein
VTSGNNVEGYVFEELTERDKIVVAQFVMEVDLAHDVYKNLSAWIALQTM